MMKFFRDDGGEPGGQRLFSTLLLFGGLFGALTLFGLIAEDVVEGDSLFFDFPLMNWLRHHSGAGLNTAMRVITTLGSAWTVVPLIVVVGYCCRRRPQAIAYLLAANAGSSLLNVTAKHAFERIRPSYWTPLVHETTYSFPSGHAMATMALVTSVWLIWRPRCGRRTLLTVGGIYVVLVGISRMYLGVHYPSDVLAGWCAAFVWCRGLALSMRNESDQKE
ncbi:phosphatase PAP2 family protein [Duganella sp. FT80W]|uniref:Phosphatase PAP2 family protein n=1 Tax=Duganella guangzhouensis TaxID=2666084 RepID=A0A6I2KVE6_9BURK|nr:phosphatase PAP2 family protein [Duganella guangzhouensis]MRW89908.1 phosphatase PAP2 family protein [Duganella guangzhouensis]